MSVGEDLLAHGGVAGLGFPVLAEGEKELLVAGEAILHGVGGAIGAILTGVFAINEYGGTPGLIEGNSVQVVYQCIGVGVVIVYDAIVSLIILKIVDMAIGLRVSDEIERDGLDLALHGEVVQ